MDRSIDAPFSLTASWPPSGRYTVNENGSYSLSPHDLESLIHAQRLIGSGKWMELPLPQRIQPSSMPPRPLMVETDNVNNGATPTCVVDGESTTVLPTNTTNEQFAEGYGKTKPIFLNEQMILGLGKIPKRDWLTGEEIFLSIGEVIDPSHLTGVQRTGTYWRIYVDNGDDRITLLADGISLRGKSIGFLPENPKTPKHNRETTTRLKISGIPLSAEDGQIRRELEKLGCYILELYRDKLRVKNKLTNCENGDRIVYINRLREHLPRFITIGKYTAGVWYYGQPRDSTATCVKCHEQGHTISECLGDWTCNFCNKTGHKQADCPTVESGEEEQITTDDDNNEGTESEQNSSNESNKPKGKQTQKTGGTRRVSRARRSKKKESQNSTLDNFLRLARTTNSGDTPSISETPTASRNPAKDRTPPSTSKEVDKKKPNLTTNE